MKDPREIVMECFEEMSRNDIPVYEAVFAMVTLATKCSLDCAPHYSTGIRTVLAGVEQGTEEHAE